MCLLCLAKTIKFVNYKKPFLSDTFYLQMSTLSVDTFKNGQFCIGRINDPDFIFDYKLIKDPMYHLWEVELSDSDIISNWWI